MNKSSKGVIDLEIKAVIIAAIKVTINVVEIRPEFGIGINQKRKMAEKDYGSKDVLAYEKGQLISIRV